MINQLCTHWLPIGDSCIQCDQLSYMYGWFTEFSYWFEHKRSKIKTNNILICSDTLDASYMYFTLDSSDWFFKWKVKMV